jgi:hypothetical protein
VVSCPMLAVVTPDGTPCVVDVGRIPVGIVRKAEDLLIIRNLSSVMPVAFKVRVAAGSGSPTGSCQVPNGIVPEDGAASLPITVKPFKSGASSFTLEIVNDTVVQAPIAVTVIYFAEDEHVTASPVRLQFPTLPVYRKVDTGEWHVASLPSSQLALSTNAWMDLKVRLHCELPVTFRHPGRPGIFVVRSGQALDLTAEVTGLPKAKYMTPEVEEQLLAGKVVVLSETLEASIDGSGRRIAVSTIAMPLAVSTCSCATAVMDLGKFGRSGESREFELVFTNLTPSLASSIVLQPSSSERNLFALPPLLSLPAADAQLTPDAALKVTVPITLTIDDRVEGTITEEIRWVNANNPNNTGVVAITARMAGSIWKFSSRRAEMLRRANGMLEAFELPVLHIDPTSGTTPPAAAAAAAAAAATTPGSGSTTDDKTLSATPTAPVRADVLSEAQLAVEAATADVSGASVSVTLNPLIVGKLTLQIINYETSNEVDNTSFTLEPRAPALAFRVRCCRAPDVSLRAIAALVAPEGPDAAGDSEKRLWLGDVTFRGRTSRDETIRVVVPRAEMATFSVAPLTAKLQFAPESADAVTAGSTNRLTASLVTKNLCTEPTVVVFTRGVANAGANEGSDLVIAFDPPRLVLDPHASSSVTVVVTGHATSFAHFPKRIQLIAVDAELPSSTVTFRVEPPAPRASESGGISSPQPSETGTKLTKPPRRMRPSRPFKAPRAATWRNPPHNKCRCRKRQHPWPS